MPAEALWSEFGKHRTTITSANCCVRLNCSALAFKPSSTVLDEVTSFNGLLMFMPKSHKSGTLAAGYDKATSSYPLWTLDNVNSIVAPTGKPGIVLIAILRMPRRQTSHRFRARSCI